MTDNPNMVAYISKLDAGDKAIICAAIRQYSHDFRNLDVHPGMLPFISIKHVVACVNLKCHNSQGQYLRAHTSVLNKLESHKWGPPLVFNGTKPIKLLRKLDDGLVAKRLGIHPDRGVPIPGLAAVIKRPRDRKMFEKATDAYDNQHPMMTLTRLTEGMWQISCPEQYQHYVDMWCLDYLTK